MNRYITFSIAVGVEIDSEYIPSNKATERRMRMALQELLHSLYGVDMVDAKFVISSNEVIDANS